MKIPYTITFLDYWHMSSGLSGGTRVDNMVVKDDNDLPYVPGKTIKGLAREAAQLIDPNMTQTIFGQEEYSEMKSYFANATLSKEHQEQIIQNRLQPFLYDEIASTKIEENGIAANNTLREIEVVVPVTLEGFVEMKNPTDEELTLMKKSLMMIKRMGLARSRGLGRCTITLNEEPNHD